VPLIPNDDTRHAGPDHWRSTTGLSVNSDTRTRGPIPHAGWAHPRATSPASTSWWHRLDHLDHTGHAGGGLGVTHVLFDRTPTTAASADPDRRSRAAPELRSGSPKCRSGGRGPRPRPLLRRSRPGVGQTPCAPPRCWEGPLGAVSPLEAPSWLDRSNRAPSRAPDGPNRWASESRSTTSISAALGPADPSAGPPRKACTGHPETAPGAWLNSTKTVGVALTVAPPASARSHSPDRNDCTAMCKATNDDEHAVSTDTAGPSTPVRTPPGRSRRWTSYR